MISEERDAEINRLIQSVQDSSTIQSPKRDQSSRLSIKSGSENDVLKLLSIAGIIGAVMTFIGSLLPWAETGLFSVSGTTDGGDGIITLIVSLGVGGALAGAFMGYSSGWPRGWPYIGAALGAAIVISVGIYHMTQLAELEIAIGTGLFLVVIGGFLTLTAVLIAFLLEDVRLLFRQPPRAAGRPGNMPAPLVSAPAVSVPPHQPPPVSAAPASEEEAVEPSVETLAANLEKLADLRERGLLTEEEYERHRAQEAGRM